MIHSSSIEKSRAAMCFDPGGNRIKRRAIEFPTFIVGDANDTAPQQQALEARNRNFTRQTIRFFERELEVSSRIIPPLIA